MIKKEIEQAINDQINAEIFSAYLYYSMSAYFDSVSLAGFAHWTRAQALEEMGHANKFFAFLNNRGGRVKLEAIDAPRTQWESPAEVFAGIYEHEVHVTDLINRLMDVAQSNSDHATVNFLQWFVAEQVEEEASADAVVQKLKLVEGTQGGLFMLDRELAARPIALPPELTGAA